MTDPQGPPHGTPLFRDGEILAGKYEVDRVLGQGGMGVVVSAHHIALGQKVAIKFLLPAAVEIPGAAQRFVREARSAVAIQSEHVARVLDVGTLESGHPYMVMEYLTGSDLGQVISAGGALPVGEAIDYVLQACEAIAEAHSLGIVHRDLKPDNVFLTRRADGSPLIKVLDFGLSKPTKEDGRTGTPSLTAMDMVAGSPQYMSPEQVRGLKNADTRTDVWALGIILYELLTGQRPFDADTVAGVFAKIAADPPLRPRALRPDLPPALEAAVLGCLEKDLARRVQDVAELAQLLAPFAPPGARTSVERVVRIGGSARSGPQASPRPSQPDRNADPMEADIPTMAAVEPAAPLAAPAPRPAPRPAPPPAEAPLEMALVPNARGSSRGLRASPEMELDLGVPPLHPAQRGRSGGFRAGADDPRAPKTRVGDLRLGGPIQVLVAAIVIACADNLVARWLGQPLQVGPVRPIWLAGPLALWGAVWLVLRLSGR